MLPLDGQQFEHTSENTRTQEMPDGRKNISIASMVTTFPLRQTFAP